MHEPELNDRQSVIRAVLQRYPRKPIGMIAEVLLLPDNPKAELFRDVSKDDLILEISRIASTTTTWAT